MPLIQNKVAHQLVAAMCGELANTIYENMAFDNQFYGIIKEIDDYIERQEIPTDYSAKELFLRTLAPQLRPIAIRCLAAELEDPTLDETYKREIFDAIMLDKLIPEKSNLN